MLLRADPSLGSRQHGLAHSLGIEQSSLVRLLDQLAGAGLLERREDPSDRRARLLHLTSRGEAVAQQAEDILDRLRHDLLGDADANDLDAAMRVLETMRRKLEDQRQRPAREGR